MKFTAEPVLILHHAVPAPGASLTSAESDAGVMEEVSAVAQALTKLGIPHRTGSVANLSALPGLLRDATEGLVFNLVENFPESTADAMQVPVICEAFGKGCTGNDSAGQVLALDKWRTKAILGAAGLPVPAGVTIPPGRKPGKTGKLPPSPWIVKPLYADASEGIHADSVIPNSAAALTKAVARVHRDFKHPALVEQFFGTREINVSVLQRGQRIDVLPPAEIEFRGFGSDRPRIVDYAAKWHTDSFEYKNTVRVIPARLGKRVLAGLREATLAAWHAVGCRDYARVDFRLDDKGNFAILEVNPNPDISPDSGFAAALKVAGIPYREFVRSVCGNALARRVRTTPDAPPPARSAKAKRATASQDAPLIRPTQADDRTGILAFMRGTGFFHDNEHETAAEVLDEAIAKGPTGHYQSFTLVADGKPAGWICWGPTPCTAGTYDVYWIGVDALCQGRGYGRILLEHAERLIRAKKGRLIVIETSGRPLYDATRGFYLKTGYTEAARIADFYGPGDARVIYTKSV